MKILLICSALEPGRDGVGDYCRRLAAQLITNGHPAAILALNDKFITQHTGERQNEGDVAVPVMRVPATGPYQIRVNEAKKWVDDFDPEWLSLQFVTFGYHPKGLQHNLAPLLQILGGNRKWHVMFHELWVGMDTGASLKHRLWGWLQKRLIISIIKKLKPAVIHTQTHLYQALLQKLGYNAGFLPLFGNIPQVEFVGQKDDALRLVVFGTIHYGAPVTDFSRELVSWMQAQGKPASVIFMGSCGSEQAIWTQAFKAEGVQVEQLGSLSPEEISRQLSKADIGVTSTPLWLTQKSGTVAAMRDHHLPIICLARPWVVSGVGGEVIDRSVYNYQPGNLAAFINNRAGYQAQPVPVSKIAGQLIDSLNGKF